MSVQGFERTDGLLSLCGLNCGLCGFRLQGGCNGCFKDSFCAAQCPMATCSVKHGNLQYCFECPEYPCKHYDGFDSYDTLVLHRNQRKDMQKAKEIGVDTYRAEQRKKVELLHRLLEKYDDGERQVFYCAVVNMLSVDDMQTILDKADHETADLPTSERAEFIVRDLFTFARENDISLE